MPRTPAGSAQCHDDNHDSKQVIYKAPLISKMKIRVLWPFILK